MSATDAACEAGREAALDDAIAADFARTHDGVPGAPLAVVVAAYNEAGVIAAVVAGVPREVCGQRTEVLVVDDGSSDDTADVAERAGAVVCRVLRNRGQGAALRLGYRLAGDRGARFIATLDADGQQDPAELELVVAPLVSGEADFVTGSRRLGAAHTTDRVRGTGVVVFGALITLLTRVRITDPANGLRAMRVEVPASVTLAERQYQASELLVGAILAGWRVVEVPTTTHQRAAGRTKKGGNLAYGARFARVVIGTWWRDRRRFAGASAKITHS
jgi:glycosyltransferase involved in cell wall biosynthesis